MAVCVEGVFELCVVGAGLVGSAAARHAAQKGHTVCLVGPPEPKEGEWNAREIFGSHYDEGRITRVWDMNADLRVLNEASIASYDDLQRQSGIAFHSPVGCLYFGQKGTDMIEKFEDEEKQKTKPTSANILDLSDRTLFREKFPFLRCSENESGYFESGGSGHISPRRLVEAQQVVAVKNGCKIIREVVKDVSFEYLQSMNALQVITEAGTKVFSRRVLLCTNAFTLMKPGLLPKNDRRLSLRLRKTTASLIRISESEAHRLRSMPSMIYRGAHHIEEQPFSSYSLPPIKYPNGNWYLKLGLYTDKEEMSTDHLTLADMKEWFISGGNEERAEQCTEFMKKLVPGLEVQGVERLCCVICHTPTGLPFIDFVTPELVVAVGGNGVSAKSSDELGRIASLLASENVWTTSIPRDRFAARWTTDGQN